MKRVEGGICAVNGVKADGARDGKYGVALIEAHGPAAATFTRNRVRTAAIAATERRLERGELDGVIANSGNANAFTGPRGIDDAEWMADLPGGNHAVASTGIIGRRLDRERVEALYQSLTPTDDPAGAERTAEAIMTTDTFPKQVAVRGDGFTVAGVAKGAGMIEPNMGTMLAFLYTDAEADAEALARILCPAVDDTFNMITVDGETSTNDTAILTATGENGSVAEEDLAEAVREVCSALARMIARDGEGATRLLQCRVTGAATRQDARAAAKAVARSPLVKTAAYGGDPNFGRAVSAIGHSGADFEEKDLSLRFGDVEVARNGEPVDFDLAAAEAAVQREEITIVADLGAGSHEASAYGCDLSPEYVAVNAAYGAEEET